MSDAKFDTMAAVQTLRKAGVADRQAEAMVRLVSDSQRNLATKADLLATKTDLTTEMSHLEVKMDAGFGLMQAKIEGVVAKLEDGLKLVRSEMREADAQSLNAMTVRVGTMFIGLAALITALEIFF